MAADRVALVPFARVPGWLERYDRQHPDTTWQVSGTEAVGTSPDGARAVLAVPFSPLVQASLPGLLHHLEHRWQQGVVLVRRGGFAVAVVDGEDIRASKVGHRYVQGRTKAGGWSQQRFARRRANQARASFDAAAEQVGRILAPRAASLSRIAIGGDRAAVSAALDSAAARPVAAVPRHWLGGVPDPRSDVLRAAVQKACSVSVALTDPRTGDGADVPRR